MRDCELGTRTIVASVGTSILSLSQTGFQSVNLVAMGLLSFAQARWLSFNALAMFSLVALAEVQWLEGDTASMNISPSAIGVWIPDARGEPKEYQLDIEGGGITTAAGFEIYEVLCSRGDPGNALCVEKMRTEVLKLMMNRVVEQACSAMVFPAGELDRCRAAGTKVIEKGVATLEKRPRESIPSVDDQSAAAVKAWLSDVTLPSFQDFEEARYAALCEELSSRAASFDEYQEGHIWGKNRESNPVVEREAFVSSLVLIDALAAGQPEWRFVEVGFNMGHSAAILLSLFPKAKVESFDLCAHQYTRPNYAFLRERFGAERLSLTCGDSRETLAAASARLAGWADGVRVDGGHRFEIVAADLANARALAKPGAALLVDDCRAVEVWAAWGMAIDLGLVAPFHPGLNWKGSCNGKYV